MVRWLIGVACVGGLDLAATACGGVDHAVRTSHSDLATPVIPRAVLFGDPERLSPRLSPDGQRLSFLAPHAGGLNVWVGPVFDLDAAKPLTSFAGRSVKNPQWAYDGRRILYQGDKGGNERYQPFALDTQAGTTHELGPSGTELLALSPKRPETALARLPAAGEEEAGLYEIEIATGKRARVSTSPSLPFVLADDSLRPRVGMKPNASGGYDLSKRDATATAAWEPFFSLPMEDAVFEPKGFDSERSRLYMTDSRQRDKQALVSIDLASGTIEVVASDSAADIEDVLFDVRTGRPLAASAVHERRRWQALDPGLESAFARLARVATGDFEIVSQSLDGSRWIVAYDADVAPTRYYLFEPKSGVAKLLFVDRPVLASQPLSPMIPVMITARDGIPLVAYVTLPREAGTSGLPARKRSPMVLYVHGGPWARDTWGFQPQDQWLANRGYAVLRVNYRGSTGFGKSFINAANREWAGKMQEDLLDAVAWAVSSGIAQPSKVAIMGGSYGGYATLVGMSFTPDVFACGVSRNGWSNLLTYFDSSKAIANQNLIAARVGDFRTADGKRDLEARSPITRIDAIDKPVLLAVGANDSRVKKAESDAVAAALDERGVPVTYLVYGDEGHVFRRAETWVSFAAITEQFLGRCLGGRVEPIGDALRGANLTVPVGARHLGRVH